MKDIKTNESKRKFGRIKEIAGVLTKSGFGYIVERIQLKRKLPFLKRLSHYESLEELDSTVPERVRFVLEELGTTFIKFGQILSTRQDLIGEEFAKEFAKLQDNTPPFSYELVRTTIKEEVGRSIDSLFEEFNNKPLASASIGQVHKAKLKNGKIVAVKIQRPGIEEQIKEDINIMRKLAKLIEKHIPDWKYFNLPVVIDEFERSIKKELNYIQEKTNMNKFQSMFEDDENIVVPKVYDEYLTRRVIITEFIDGVKISELSKSKRHFNKQLIAKRGAEAFFKQVLVHGFFHADPHPGNLLVLEQNRICFLDFGMVGHIDKEFMDNLAQLFVFLIDYNVNGLINQLTNMGFINETIDIKSFKYDTMDIMDLYHGAQLKDIRLGKIISELMMLLVKYNITQPKEIILLSRALIIIEGIGKDLDPEFNIVVVCKPYAKKVIRQRISPRRIMDIIKDDFFEFEHFIKILPRTMKEIFSKIALGKINIEFEHKNLDRFSSNLERISNKVSFALIISALIVASSLIMQTDKGQLLFGFPILGIVIFFISAIMGLGLVISIIRFKKM
ncbi:MAG: AarF/ABC1/UbiB kinase family protein [Nanoarchaeota archaeon]|nr:AarF/ABC1/UbiB kinase family protein [Nanoarchaeota archaeon]